MIQFADFLVFSPHICLYVALSSSKTLQRKYILSGAFVKSIFASEFPELWGKEMGQMSSLNFKPLKNSNVWATGLLNICSQETVL